MEYEVFRQELEHYYSLYEIGLKKQANKDIEDFVKVFEKDSAMDDIFYHFVQELCDGDEYEFLKERGNGRIPYVLDRCVRDWLYKRCLEEKMPELRWFYELYRSDKVGIEYAIKFLEKAFDSEACDDKTVSLLFDSWLSVLGWGAHHFPEACIISEKAIDHAFEQCKLIMSNKPVSERLKAECKYYEILYACYDQYVKDDKKRDFNEYCNASDIKFYESKAYYYK